MKITAVIITYNEARNIERCLQSLRNVVDEIVVVDSFSTDNTLDICSSFGAKILQQEWLGYSAQKNFANAQAQHPWVLSLDADEALSEELAKSILHLKTQDDSQSAYSVNRMTNYCGHWIRHGDWYPDTKLRLWKKELGAWQGSIHEEVALQQGYNAAKLDGDLLHYSYYSVIEHVSQMKKFTELMAQEQVKKGMKSTVFKIIFSPWVKFLKSYFLKLGILDGYAGFVVASMSAHATFLKYVRTKELQGK